MRELKSWHIAVVPKCTLALCVLAAGNAASYVPSTDDEISSDEVDAIEWCELIPDGNKGTLWNKSQPVPSAWLCYKTLPLILFKHMQESFSRQIFNYQP